MTSLGIRRRAGGLYLPLRLRDRICRMRAAALLGLCLTALSFFACATESGPKPEARSLLGQNLYSPPIADDARQKMEAQLAEARAAWSGTADDVEGLIWVGRRTAYLGRFRDAIAIFTDGIAKHPEDARLYRHRGHRYLTVRELDLAV